MKMQRRDFIKLLSSSTTFGLAYGYGLFSRLPGGSGSQALAKQLEDISLRPVDEKWVPAVCRQCPGGCGVLVRVYGKRAVKLDGNPLHPINHGRLCARGQAGLQLLYNPDRIATPLARAGERGEGKWKPVSWDEALETVGEKLRTLRKQGKPHQLAMLTGAQRGLDRAVSERFMAAYGSPNLVRYETDRSVGMHPALNLMQGQAAGFTYDIEGAAYILSFNSALLEDHWSPVQLFRAYGKFRRGRKENRGKLVHAEPRLSVTGAKADEWIPVKPGSEGILAMGIASILIVEKRYDENFVAERCFGFDDWTDESGTLRPGFRTLVIQEYPLDRVVKLTGVPRDIIIRTAREFARVQPALAIGNDGPGVRHQGIYNRMAIHALNALVGNIQKPGGVLANARPADLSLPPVRTDRVADQGLSRPRLDGAEGDSYAMAKDVPTNVTDSLLEKKPYPIEMLMLNGANPLYDSLHPDRLVKTLKQIPTIVSFSPFHDETTQWADLVLPDTTYLEKWQLDTSYTLQGNPVVNLSRPVLKAPFDGRDTNEVLLALAASVGKPVADAFPSTRIEDLAKLSLQPLSQGGSGEPFGAPLEELWTRLLEQSGWKVRTEVDFEKLWADLLERGGWWDPVYYHWEWRRALATPSGRFEFYSLGARDYFAKLKGMARDMALQKTPGLVNVQQADAACLPAASRARAGGNETLYALEVNPYFIPILSGITHTNQPWLQDVTGFHVYQSWYTWVEIHPETAHEVGVHNGDWVFVESPGGKVKGRVRTYEGAMPHVINLPVGLGHTSGGRWTAGIGENVLKLLQARQEPFTGQEQFQPARARLIKV
jgi:anaerobic selenocysteine-containing dehydrogenase